MVTVAFTTALVTFVVIVSNGAATLGGAARSGRLMLRVKPLEVKPQAFSSPLTSRKLYGVRKSASAQKNCKRGIAVDTDSIVTASVCRFVRPATGNT